MRNKTHAHSQVAHKKTKRHTFYVTNWKRVQQKQRKRKGKKTYLRCAFCKISTQTISIVCLHIMLYSNVLPLCKLPVAWRIEVEELPRHAIRRACSHTCECFEVVVFCSLFIYIFRTIILVIVQNKCIYKLSGSVSYTHNEMVHLKRTQFICVYIVQPQIHQIRAPHNTPSNLAFDSALCFLMVKWPNL